MNRPQPHEPRQPGTPAPTAPAPSTTSTSRTVDALRELILRGELAPGARLAEVELAGRLGVSRTPVRSALTQLATEGLVEVAPNRGARVATWTVHELEGIFDLRTALEPRAAALAARHATADDTAELAHLAERMVEVGTPGRGQDLDALAELNRRFHDRLSALADNAALANALSGAVHAPIVLRNFHTYDVESLRRSLAHHVEIVAAIRAGDAVWAEAVMTAHMRNARAVMVAAAQAAEQDTERA